MVKRVEFFAVIKKINKKDVHDSRNFNLIGDRVGVDFKTENRKEVCTVLRTEDTEYTFEVINIIFSDRTGKEYTLNIDEIGKDFDLYILSKKDINKYRTPYTIYVEDDIVNVACEFVPVCNDNGFPAIQRGIAVPEQAISVYEWSNVDVIRYDDMSQLYEDFEENKPVVIFRNGSYNIYFMDTIMDKEHILFRGSGDKFDVHQSYFNSDNKAVYKIYNIDRVNITMRTTDAYIQTCEVGGTIINNIDEFKSLINVGDRIIITNSNLKRQFILEEELYYNSSNECVIANVREIFTNTSEFIKISDYINSGKYTVSVYKPKGNDIK